LTEGETETGRDRENEPEVEETGREKKRNRHAE